MDLNLRQLQAFVLAVELGSFSAAARRLNKAQSAVSTLIGNLELDIDQPLFERTGRNPVLTPLGEILYREAKLIMARCDHFGQLAMSVDPELESELVLGFDDLYDVPFTKEMLVLVEEEFPELELNIREGQSQSLVQQVIAGDIDMAFILSEPLVPGTLVSRRLPPVELAYLAGPEHPLAQQTGLDLSDLMQYRQVILPGHLHIGSEQISPKVWKVQSYSGARYMLENGHCWMLAPLALQPLSGDLARQQQVRLDVKEELVRSLRPRVIWRANHAHGLVHRRLTHWLEQFCPD